MNREALSYDGHSILSRIAQLDQRTALPDQCLHSAEADVTPPKEGSPGWTPISEVACVNTVAAPARGCQVKYALGLVRDVETAHVDECRIPILWGIWT